MTQGSGAAPVVCSRLGRTAARGPHGSGGSDLKAPALPFPTCRACWSVLPPMAHQGNGRVWCSDACRMWAAGRPGERRQRAATFQSTRDALRAWAGPDWDRGEQPWDYRFPFNARQVAEELLREELEACE